MKKLFILAVLVLMACTGTKQSQDNDMEKIIKKEAKRDTKKESGLKERDENHSQATQKTPATSEKKPLTIAEKCNKINMSPEFQTEDMDAPIGNSYNEQKNAHEDCSCIEIITCDGLDICYTFKCSKSGIIEAFK